MMHAMPSWIVMVCAMLMEDGGAEAERARAHVFEDAHASRFAPMIYLT